MNKRHALILLACCLFPLVVPGAIFFLGIPASPALLAGLALFCPLSLLLMKFTPDHVHDAPPATARQAPLQEAP